MFTDCSTIDAEALRLHRGLEDIAILTQQCIEENARTVQDQTEFTARYNAYVERFETAKVALEKVEQDRQLRLSRAEAFDGFIRTLASIEGSLQEFDDKIWLTTLEKATVYHDGMLVFRFNDGSEIEA